MPIPVSPTRGYINFGVLINDSFSTIPFKFSIISLITNLENEYSLPIESRQFSQFTSAIHEFDGCAAIEQNRRGAQFECHAANFRVNAKQIDAIFAIRQKTLNGLLVPLSRASDSTAWSRICSENDFEIIQMNMIKWKNWSYQCGWPDPMFSIVSRIAARALHCQ